MDFFLKQWILFIFFYLFFQKKKEEKKNTQIVMEVYNLAFEGKFDDVKAVVANGANINMALIGAADGKQSEIKNNMNWDGKKVKWDGKHAEILQWAFEKGACLLFSFKHENYNSISNISHYSHNISMLCGPGEVSKGTFNTK